MHPAHINQPIPFNFHWNECNYFSLRLQVANYMSFTPSLARLAVLCVVCLLLIHGGAMHVGDFTIRLSLIPSANFLSRSICLVFCCWICLLHFFDCFLCYFVPNFIMYGFGWFTFSHCARETRKCKQLNFELNWISICIAVVTKCFLLNENLRAFSIADLLWGPTEWKPMFLFRIKPKVTIF